MNRRTAIKLALSGTTAAGLAGCTGTGESQSTTESTESAEPAIRNPRINEERPAEFEVSFPTVQSVDNGSLSEDEAIQQVADQFAIDIQYESPVQTESTLHLEYDEDVIPKEDEEPIDQDIDTVTQQGTITHDSEVPENLIRYMLKGNPRNLELTITGKNPEIDQIAEESIELNYGDAAAEAGLSNTFNSYSISHIDANWNLSKVDVSRDIMLLEYETDANTGTIEFGNLLGLGSGFCTGAIENVRTPYAVTVRGIDQDGNSYEFNFDANESESLIAGEVDSGEFSREETREYFDEF